MSYCRWGCLNGRSDVYVYDSWSGFVTHVSKCRTPSGAPELSLETYIDQGPEAYKKAKAAREAWSENNPNQPIEHEEAGANFVHATPGECADNLERLAREGFIIPDWAITALREEQAGMEILPTNSDEVAGE